MHLNVSHRKLCSHTTTLLHITTLPLSSLFVSSPYQRRQEIYFLQLRSEMGLRPRTHQFLPQPLLLMMLMLILHSAPVINATSTSSEKHDQILVPQVPDSSMKCMTCPCVNPCSDQHPPPPPPPPPPLPPPPPPPRTQYCGQQVPPPPRFIYVTEPPPPRFTYITTEPGSLYGNDPSNFGFYSAAGRNVIIGFMVLVGCGILEALIIGFW